MIANWLARGNVRYPAVMLTNGYAFAWAPGSASDPHYAVHVTTYRYPLDSSIPIPRGTRPAPGGDAHLTIYDTEHDRSHDLWQAAYDAQSNTWSAGSGVSYPIGGSPPSGTGSVAAGIPALALAIWPEEIKAGVIDHALAFTAPHIAPTAFRYPASHTDGHGQPSDLPIGAWLRMPISVTAKPAWPTWTKVLFAALQHYGMYLVDSGGALAIYGVDPINGGLSWSQAGISGSTASFPSDFPWSKLQLLSPPPS